jgi:hypothetical protein
MPTRKEMNKKIGREVVRQELNGFELIRVTGEWHETAGGPYRSWRDYTWIVKRGGKRVAGPFYGHYTALLYQDGRDTRLKLFNDDGYGRSDVRRYILREK